MLVPALESEARRGNGKRVRNLCHADLDCRVGGQEHGPRFDPHAHAAAAEAHAQLERTPRLRQMRVEAERAPAGRSPAKPSASACQTPPIVARWTPPGGRAGQVVEIDAAPPAAALASASSSIPARAKSAAWIARRERAAVRGARLVEARFGVERARRDLLGHEVVEHQHVRLLHDLGALRHARGRAEGRLRSAGGARRPRSPAARARRSRRTARRAGLRVVAVDERLGQIEPAIALARRSLRTRPSRPRGAGSSAP